MFRTPISACVITFNEERCIGACLDSLGICDEIIVVTHRDTWTELAGEASSSNAPSAIWCYLQSLRWC